MDDATKSAFIAWLRENLELEVEFSDKYGPGNDVYIGLKFKGEDGVFTSAFIAIPRQEAD